MEGDGIRTGTTWKRKRKIKPSHKGEETMKKTNKQANK